MSSRISAYGDKERIKILRNKSINNGDTCNESVFTFNSHFGTHIDFPYHFCEYGKKSSDFQINDYVFDNIGIIKISLINSVDRIINNQLIGLIDCIDPHIDILLINTGFSNYRNEKEYWHDNPGLHPDIAIILREKFPKLRAIGIDSISISNYQQRDLGRMAHKEFLCKHNFLIVEDMNLSVIENNYKLMRLIISPLLIENVDAVPVTVIAEVELIND